MMQRRMVHSLPFPISPTFFLTHTQLSKEDEASAGDENEVRREDQEKINRFSRLHQREVVLEDVLKGKRVRLPLY